MSCDILKVGQTQVEFKLIHMGFGRDFIISIQFEIKQYSISWFLKN